MVYMFNNSNSARVNKTLVIVEIIKTVGAVIVAICSGITVYLAVIIRTDVNSTASAQVKRIEELHERLKYFETQTAILREREDPK